MEESLFLTAPPEIRILVYGYLFHSEGKTTLRIRSLNAGKRPDPDSRIRTRYHVLDRSLHRRCYETTYYLAEDPREIYFCPALMRTNRRIYAETVHLLYGNHSFDFGSDIEAVEPFLSDLTLPSRSLIRDISLYKRGPIPLYENDRCEWRSVCRFLRQNGAVRKLRLVVQGGRPNVTWDGPKEFSASDFKLLADLKHESLDWVSELAQVEGIEELEILPDVHYCPPPTSTSMLIFAAFSASIEKGLTEFVRSQLRLA